MAFSAIQPDARLELEARTVRRITLLGVHLETQGHCFRLNDPIARRSPRDGADF